MAHGEHDRRLQEAAARSPEIAAVLAGRRPKDHDASARTRRLLFIVAGATVGIGLLWLTLAWRAPGGAKGAEQARGEPAQEIDTAHYLSPIEARPVGEGEAVAPFAGFALSIDTEPPGALVSIAGVPRGEAPVLANIECRGERVVVTAEKAGFRPARQEIACRADTLVKLALRLEP